MTLDPARPEKTRRGVWGGVGPPVGLGFGIPPAARVRVRPHYPELPVPGPRRDMGLGQVLQAESKKRFVHSHPPSLNIRNVLHVNNVSYVQGGGWEWTNLFLLSA